MADSGASAGLAARGTGKPFSETYWRRMEAMLEYVAGIMDSGGHVPLSGDVEAVPLATGQRTTVPGQRRTALRAGQQAQRDIDHGRGVDQVTARAWRRRRPAPGNQ